jgi:hypothetical protein
VIWVHWAGLVKYNRFKPGIEEAGGGKYPQKLSGSMRNLVKDEFSLLITVLPIELQASTQLLE